MSDHAIDALCSTLFVVTVIIAATVIFLKMLDD